MKTIEIRGENYTAKPSVKGEDDCKKCAFYDVIMTPFRTRGICIVSGEVSCCHPEPVYFIEIAK